jgi:hypothetical protein
MTDKPLPDFALQWIQQWKQAAPRLQAIRDEELRRLNGQQDSVERRTGAKTTIFDRYPEKNGMVIMQRWFMRRQLLQQSGSNREPQ